jgi:cold shock CspA family protein
VTDDLDIRRLDLQGVRRTGTVRWFKDEKGYGRITADDGEVLFVHFSGIDQPGGGYRTLTEGQRVSFVWDGSMAAHRRHAAQQVRIEG